MTHYLKETEDTSDMKPYQATDSDSNSWFVLAAVDKAAELKAAVRKDGAYLATTQPVEIRQ